MLAGRRRGLTITRPRDFRCRLAEAPSELSLRRLDRTHTARGRPRSVPNGKILRRQHGASRLLDGRRTWLRLGRPIFGPVECRRLLMSLWHSTQAGIIIPTGGPKGIRAVRQSTVGHGQVIHDLVVEEVAGSGQRVMVQSNRLGEHSVVRHLSMKKEEKRGGNRNDQVEGGFVNSFKDDERKRKCGTTGRR